MFSGVAIIFENFHLFLQRELNLAILVCFSETHGIFAVVNYAAYTCLATCLFALC